MTAPEPRRRPLPALVLILALCVLAGLVWYHVLNRKDTSAAADSPSVCPTPPSTSAPAPATAARHTLPPPPSVSVVVLNSTRRNGLAGRVANALDARGFTVSDTANDDKAFGGHGVIKGVGEIRFGSRARSGAVVLHFFVPGARLRPTGSEGSKVYLALGKHFRGLADAAAVKRAISRRHVVLALPSPTPTPGC